MKTGNLIIALLAGMGGLFAYQRYSVARKAGVPMLDAIKTPFADAAALAAQAAGDAKKALAPVNDIPAYGGYVPDASPDAQLTPTWLAEEEETPVNFNIN